MLCIVWPLDKSEYDDPRNIIDIGMVIDVILITREKYQQDFV